LIVEDLNRNAAFRIKLFLSPRFSHFFFICGDPDRAARIMFDRQRKLFAEFIPKLLRITSEGKLRFRIVHHHEMAHAGGSSAATNNSSFNNGDTQSLANALRRTG
jgi:hypothetical protein